MDKFADERYVNGDVFYNGCRIQKDKDCKKLQRNVSQDIYVPMEGHIFLDRLQRNVSQDIYVPMEGHIFLDRLQRNVSQDIYVPMEGHIFLDRLANFKYENDDVLCDVCHNDSKKLHSDLSQDIYVPIEVAYNFMNRLANDTYGNGDVNSNICHLQKDNDCKGLQRNVSEDAYVSMNSSNVCFDENSIENPSQMLAPLAPTDIVKPIKVQNNIYRKKAVKKIKNFAKNEDCQIKIKNQTNRNQIRPLSERFNQIPSLESEPEDTKRCYSEIYDVPNTRPILPPKIKRNKEPVFRSRSNACVSQNIRTYLKETKSAGI